MTCFLSLFPNLAVLYINFPQITGPWLKFEKGRKMSETV